MLAIKGIFQDHNFELTFHWDRMTKKQTRVIMILIFLIIAGGGVAISVYEFRQWICKISQENICINLWPPPPHIATQLGEHGRKHGVNF